MAERGARRGRRCGRGRADAHGVPARAAQPSFDFDLLGLAARLYLRRDWDAADILRDDFKPAELKAASERHNETCVKGCRYGL